MKIRILLVVSLMLLVSYDAPAQCSMCRAVLESDPDQSGAEAINDGIVYLMAFPYLLMAGLGYFIWKTRKKSRSEE